MAMSGAHDYEWITVRRGRNRGRSRGRVEPTGPRKQRGGSWFQSSWDRGQGAFRGMDRAPPFPHSVGGRVQFPHPNHNPNPAPLHLSIISALTTKLTASFSQPAQI